MPVKRVSICWVKSCLGDVARQMYNAIQISSLRIFFLQAVLEWCGTLKAKAIVLHALLNAIPFWHKMGFAEVEDIWV